MIFSLFNWFFEILKWKTLVSFSKKISFKAALIQSLSSLTASLITPNRIGEYGAKALYFEKPLRNQILVLNLVGNVFQLFVTLFFGLFGVYFFLNKFKIDIDYNPIFIFLGVTFLISTAIWYLFKKGVSIKGHTLQSLRNFILKIPQKTTIKIGFLSVLRYLVFSHQFYFLILLFTIEISYFDAMIGVFLMYFMASIIPMLSLFDVVIKSSVALWIFSFYNVNEIDILSISLLMWIFNFVIPSVFGSYFVLTFNPKEQINFKE